MRVTQVLALLKLDGRVREAIFALPAATKDRYVSERSLRPLLGLSPERQLRALGWLVQGKKVALQQTLKGLRLSKPLGTRRRRPSPSSSSNDESLAVVRTSTKDRTALLCFFGAAAISAVSRFALLSL